MCFNLQHCTLKIGFAINQSFCAIKKHCNYCISCKSHYVYHQCSAPHINKITSFYTQTAILHYQKTAEIAEIVEKPPTNARKQEDDFTVR